MTLPKDWGLGPDYDTEYGFEAFCERFHVIGAARGQLQRFLQDHGRPGVDFRLGSRPGSTTNQYMHFSMRQIHELNEWAKAKNAAARLTGDYVR